MPITPVADETQPQAQPVAQPQVTPTPDPAHVILSAAQTDDKTKADAWEIYHNHEGKEFEDKLAATSLPQDAKSALWQAKTRAATTAQQMKAQPQAQPKQDVVENFLDADVKKSIPGTPSLKPVYETGKGLYQGLVGEEATPDIKGAPTGTVASPNNPAGVANYGVTPGNVGYNVGKMGHGIYEFGKGLVQDIAGNTPIAVPDTVAGKPNASFWDRVKGIGDPTAHTLMAKYVTAPSMAEREASEKEMEEYFKTKGPGAAGHAISAFLHGTLGEYVPAVGPLAMALTDQAQKGDIGGAMAQIAALYAFEKGTGAAKKGIKDRVSAATADLTKTPEVKQAEANVDALGKARDAAQAKLDAAKAQHQAYTASHEQGIGSPEKVANEVKKAQDVYDEAEAHHEIAKEDLSKKQAESTIPKQVGGAVGRAVGKALPTPAPEPEAPITAAPALKAPGPAPKLPQIGVSPAHATTTIPQEPTPAPKVPGYGRIELANGQGTMGMPKLLTEGTPEVKPEAKPAEAPKPVTDEGALRDLKATKGEVVESPEKKVGRLLQEALKPAEKSPEYAGEERRETERKPLMSPVEIEEAMKNRKPVHTPFDVTQGAMDTIKRDQAMPKHPAEETAVKEQPVLPKEEPTGYAAKKEEVVPVGTEGREPVKSAAEYSPDVEQKVNELSDANLRKLAQAHGLEPNEYDLNARDARRHRVERDQLAKDIVQQMGEDEKINLGRAAASAEREGLFQGADTSAKGRAARAEKMFPRLRGPVDENGNPKISGGAPSKAEDAIREIEEKFPVNPEKPGAGTEPKELASMKEGKPEATFTVSERDGKLRLKGIQSLNPGTGAGSRVLKSLTDIADKHNLAMELTASPYGDEATRLNSDQLKEWYSRNGFVPEEGTDPSRGYMVREPKRTVGTAEAAKSDNEHFANAKKELGPKASISDVAKRAQELKDESAKPRFKPVGYDEYAKAVKDNPQAATLTDPEAMKNNRAFSNGKGVYYSISPEGDLQGLVNNSGEKGAIAKAMPDAIAKGGKTLDAWDIYLPKQYEKYGFERTKSVPYDTKNYGEPPQNLKDAWKAQGWKEGDPYPSVQYMKLKETPRVNAKGSPIDEYGNPTVSGGAPEKKLPTGDELIKKYGESSGDPKDLSFILPDGRAVANAGFEHDTMLGGKATDAKPPRERFVAEGNVRVRPHQGTAGREVSFSIPEQGISEAQLKYIQKMSPQLSSGSVMLEVGKPGGNYKVIPYGEASADSIAKAVREIASVNNEKGSPIDENGNPTVSGGSPSAGTGTAKTKALPKLAEKHLTPEERASVTKSSVGTKNFVENFDKIPPLHEWVDAARGGEGARHWYQRSGKAFDALHAEAPEYFKEGDRERFGNFVAALSPRQMVHNNLGEALNAWKQWVDDGRPTGKEMEKSLRDSISSAPNTKVPNAMKALSDQEMWPDLSKNRNFKVSSFGKNLNQYLNYATNDGWQALFGGLDEKTVSNPSSYHPLSVMTRAAAEELGWSTAEAQSAIWSFTQALKEKGEVNPHEVRAYSEDFADIMANNHQIRQQLKDLGVDLGKLDQKLEAIGEKPAITSGTSPTAEHSAGELEKRIEAARGTGSIPAPKTGNLFREVPANRNTYRDEAVGFEPSEFENEKPSLEKLGEKKKKYPYGNVGR